MKMYLNSIKTEFSLSLPTGHTCEGFCCGGPYGGAVWGGVVGVGTDLRRNGGHGLWVGVRENIRVVEGGGFAGMKDRKSTRL